MIEVGRPASAGLPTTFTRFLRYSTIPTKLVSRFRWTLGTASSPTGDACKLTRVGICADDYATGGSFVDKTAD
jgi:hypothetical protein